MARAGFALRDKWAMEAAAAKLCSCGHRTGDHAELGFDRIIETNEQGHPIGERYEPKPGHLPWHFHCRVEGCSCVRDETT